MATTGLSFNAVRKLERDGVLTVVKDARGVVRFPPGEVERLAAASGAEPKAAASKEMEPDDPQPESFGLLTSRAFALFERGVTLTDAVIELKQPLSVVRALHSDWAGCQKCFVVPAQTRLEIERLCTEHVGAMAVPDHAMLLKLVARLLPMASELRRTKTAITQLEGDNAELQQRVADLESEADELNRAYGTVEDQLQAITLARDHARQRVSELAADIQDATALADQAAQEREAAVAEARELRSLLDAAQARSERVQHDLMLAQAAAAVALEHAVRLATLAGEQPEG